MKSQIAKSPNPKSHLKGFRLGLDLSLVVLLSAACLPVSAAPIPDAAPAPTTGLPATFTPLPPPTVPPPPSSTLTPTASPSAAPPSSPTTEPEITLLFTGDINPARCVYQIARDAGDMALPYRPLAETLQSADLTIGSLDASISDYNPPSPCAEFHRNLLAPAETVQGLQFAGFDLMAVATNHIKDCGLVRGCGHESLLDTLANLRAASIRPVGAGRDLAEAVAPVIVEVRGVRFAFLAFTAINGEVWAAEATPGAAPFLKDVYVDAVRRARAAADVVVVLPHWGREFTGKITWEQALGAQALIQAGAALVVGNNPHHVQAVETYPNGAVVAYALGNFVFDQEWTDGTLFTIQGLLLRARFRGPVLQGVDLLPIRIYDNFQPHPAPLDDAAQILRDVDASLLTKPRLTP